MCARLFASGGVAPYAASAAAGNISVVAEPGGSVLYQGLRNGTDTATIGDASGSAISIPVLVAPDAGVLPASLTLQLAGRVAPTLTFEAVALAAQIGREAHLQPGARVAAIDPHLLPSNLSAVTPWSATLPVALSGRNRWRDVQGSLQVQVELIEMPPLQPSLLFFSDDPEKVQSDQAGVLFRQTLPPLTAVRMFTYTEFESPGRRLYVLLQSKGTSHVQILGDVAGPGFYDDVGHKATVRYLRARRTQQSVMAAISASDPVVLEVGDPTTDVPRVVSAIYDLRLVDGDPADVIVVAGSDSGDPRAFIQDVPPAAFEDTHFRTGVYPLDAEAPLMLSASIGVLFGTPPGGTSATVGSWAVPPIVGKRYLIGDYGVVRPLRITLTNVSTQVGTVYFYERPSPQGATMTVFFDGEPAPVELPCLQVPRDAPVRYLIRKFTVPPGGTPLVVTGEYMTEGGSAYPVDLGLSLDAPLDPPAKSTCSPASSTPVQPQ
jgi:hypothetical protein